MPLEHLRAGGKRLIQTIKRVKDQMGMDMGGTECAPYRIKYDQIRRWDELEHSLALCSCNARYGQRRTG
jgi:hypothetical protein